MVAARRSGTSDSASRWRRVGPLSREAGRVESKLTDGEARRMATDNSTITDRLNKIADELEERAKVPKTPDGNTVSEALDRVADAVEKLPPK